MKTTIHAVLTVSFLPLVACGTAPMTSATTGATGNAAESAATVPTTLTSDRAGQLTAAYSSLDGSEFVTANSLSAFAINEQFVNLDVSQAGVSTSLGGSVSLLVPAGVTGVPADPNQAKQFYVQVGNANSGTTTYGPFDLTENDYALTDMNMSLLVAAYQALSSTGFTPSEQVEAFPANQLFAQVNESTAIRSISFGHTVTLLVPAGVTGMPVDANEAQVFYVSNGASTNTPAAIYGPFNIQQ